MVNDHSQLLQQIANAKPANEAEVETKILLHIFRLLGFTDVDRADKPTVKMHFGREKKDKEADFILYNGAERTLINALIAVEAKRIGENLDGAELQALSYALWAGTPFYLACNGETLLAANFLPGGEPTNILKFPISDIEVHWDKLLNFIGRRESVLVKERIAYMLNYLPNVEDLPPNEFFHEYLGRLHERFAGMVESRQALYPPTSGQMTNPQIPVTIKLQQRELGDVDIAQILHDNSSLIYIEGNPGSGKSTLCKRVAFHLSVLSKIQGSNIIPIYLKLNNGIPSTIFDAFSLACQELGVRVLSSLYKKPLQASKLLLILDGLDELEITPTQIDNLKTLLQEQQEFGILLTSRPLERIQDLANDQGFGKGIIRELTDDELYTVLEHYLVDKDKLEYLLDESSRRKLPNLRSPLMALMVIRVANSNPDWTTMNTFTLYEKYVEVLHSYFNSSTVRGNDSNPVLFSHIMLILSDIALLLQQSETEASPISFNEIIEKLSENHHEIFISAFLNMGLLTSLRGKAIFVHRTFQEFGFAWKMISSLRNQDPNGFATDHSTEMAYSIANSELQESDELLLRYWINHPIETVRRRAVGVLRHGCSSETLEVMRTRLMIERASRVWTGLVKTLINHRETNFLNDIVNGRPLNNFTLKKLAYAMRKTKEAQYLSGALQLAEMKHRSPMILCAFELAFSLNDTRFVDRFSRLLRNASPSQRKEIANLVGEYRGSQLSLALMVPLLHTGNSRKVLIRLLNVYRDQLATISSEEMARICNTLTGTTPLNQSDRTRLNRFVNFLNSKEELTQPLDSLLNVCKNILER